MLLKDMATNNAQCKGRVAAVLTAFQGQPLIGGIWHQLPGGPGEEEEKSRRSSADHGTVLPALEVPLYTCRGVGEVMAGHWVGAGSMPWVVDLTGWTTSVKVQKSWNMCWALPASETFEGGFKMTAGERGVRKPSQG